MGWNHQLAYFVFEVKLLKHLLTISLYQVILSMKPLSDVFFNQRLDVDVFHHIQLVNHLHYPWGLNSLDINVSWPEISQPAAETDSGNQGVELFWPREVDLWDVESERWQLAFFSGKSVHVFGIDLFGFLSLFCCEKYQRTFFSTKKKIRNNLNIHRI